MHSKIIGSASAPTYVLVLDPGDEATAARPAPGADGGLTGGRRSAPERAAASRVAV
jgi:hypothetical protein